MFYVAQSFSVAKSCPTLCDPMDCSTLGFPVLYYVPEFLQTHVHWDFPGITSGKELACQWRRHKKRGFNPWVIKIPGEGNGNPLQYPWLENPMGRIPWQAIVHRVAKIWTQLKRLSMHTSRHVCPLSRWCHPTVSPSVTQRTCGQTKTENITWFF